MAEAKKRDRMAKFTRKQVEDLAKSFVDIAAEMQGFAELLADSDFAGELEVDGGARIKDAEKWAILWLYGLKTSRRLKGGSPEAEPGQNGAPTATAKPKKRSE